MLESHHKDSKGLDQRCNKLSDADNDNDNDSAEKAVMKIHM